MDSQAALQGLKPHHQVPELTFWILKQIEELNLHGVQVQAIWILGHEDNWENELADRTANDVVNSTELNNTEDLLNFKAAIQSIVRDF